MTRRITYVEGILEAHQHLLKYHPEVFVIGQGVTSPWYVGNSMRDLDREFGPDRVIDSPVAEEGITGIGLGASLCGFRVLVVHPRMDFMILASNAIVNQAAKWFYMFGSVPQGSLTIRAILNRGGEQGAQHSQSFQSWFAHIPGLRVVMPYSPLDARDLLIQSVLCNDPVIYIDDRWLYEQEAEWKPIKKSPLKYEGSSIIRSGIDCTLVGSGYSTYICERAARALKECGISVEVCDLRVLNPMKVDPLERSVKKTRRLVVVDGGWSNCGISSEVISRIVETVEPSFLLASPIRITLPDCPAPASKVLEKTYYPDEKSVVRTVKKLMHFSSKSKKPSLLLTSHEAHH